MFEKMTPISGFIIICLLVTFGYFLGLLTFIGDYEENKCQMTYMYQYPQFVRIYLKADEQYQKYGLYAYSEGHFTELARKMRFDGIPVLFIPGNAGSFRQVRSFASVALVKSVRSRPGFHFDFFTVDLNTEFSGLNGALLTEQTEYVNHCITRVLELYKSHKRNVKSLVIMGHSMGGILARGLIGNFSSDINVLPLIITLATPHARPLIALDLYMADYYNSIQKEIVDHNKTTIISLSGGYNDFLVAPFSTYTTKFENIHAVTTSVPLVWLPIDHLCILWCKQLVLAITRALFDVVDLETKQISTDLNYRHAVFKHHLVRNSGIKIRQSERYKMPVSLNGSTKDRWIENLQKRYTISLPHGTKQKQWHMIRLFQQEEYRYLTILAVNLEVRNWVFACAAVHQYEQQRICSDGIHLSHLSNIAPSNKAKLRTLQLDLQELKHNYTLVTDVVAFVEPTQDPVTLYIDRYGTNDSRIEVNMPKWWSFTLHKIIPETPEKIITYELTLPQLQHIIQSYKLYVEPLICNHPYYQASASLIIPWTNHDIHAFINEEGKNPLNIRLYSSKPVGSNESAFIRLTLDPTCRYSISIQNSVIGMLGQMARLYSPLLVANVAAVILLAFRNQMLSIEQSKTCSVFFTAVKQGVKPYYILTMVKLSSRVLSWKGFLVYLPCPDWQIILEEGNDFFLLPLLLYMCSVGIVWLLGLGLTGSLIFCESTFQKLTSKLLARTVTGILKFSDWLIGGLQKLPCLVAVLLITLSVTTCGGLALCIGSIFYFLKLAQMSQEYIEGLVVRIVKYLTKRIKRKIQKKPSASQTKTKPGGDTEELKDKVTEVIESTKTKDLILKKKINENDVDVVPGCSSDNNKKGPKLDYSSIFYHFSIFLLWCIVACLNLPYVLTWAHNFKYNKMLNPDPSFIPGIVLSFCAIPLWQLDFPKPNLRGYIAVSHLLNVLAAISLIYAPISLYRLTYVLTASIAIITLHQSFAPSKPEVIISEDITNETTTEELYNDIKAKWE